MESLDIRALIVLQNAFGNPLLEEVPGIEDVCDYCASQCGEAVRAEGPVLVTSSEEIIKLSDITFNDPVVKVAPKPSYRQLKIRSANELSSLLIQMKDLFSLKLYPQLVERAVRFGQAYLDTENCPDEFWKDFLEFVYPMPTIFWEILLRESITAFLISYRREVFEHVPKIDYLSLLIGLQNEIPVVDIQASLFYLSDGSTRTFGDVQFKLPKGAVKCDPIF